MMYFATSIGLVEGRRYFRFKVCGNETVKVSKADDAIMLMVGQPDFELSLSPDHFLSDDEECPVTEFSLNFEFPQILLHKKASEDILSTVLKIIPRLMTKFTVMVTARTPNTFSSKSFSVTICGQEQLSVARILPPTKLY